MIAAGISGYKVWYFRKNGYCITQRPSISNPIEAKYVYSHDNQTQRFNDPRDYDLEKGALTISKEGLHPGRKLSWDAAPLSAPACAPDFMEARPTFRTVNYNHNLATETSPLAQYAPINRRPVANSRFTPPRLQLYGPGDRTPALIMDYGGTTPYGAPAPTPTYTPNPQHKHPPYHVSPIRQDYRGSIANAPYTATYNNNHNNDNHNMNQILQNSLRKGYRSNYASGVPTEGYNTYNRRNSTLRMALPGPATTHAGGYQSAYHTPLPTAMMSPRGATSRGFKRESTVQFYSQQQAFADKGFYAR